MKPGTPPSTEETELDKAETTDTVITNESFSNTPELSANISYTNKTGDSVNENLENSHLDWDTTFKLTVDLDMTKVKQGISDYHVKDSAGNVVDDAEVIVDPNHDSTPTYKVNFKYELQDVHFKSFFSLMKLQNDDNPQNVTYGYKINSNTAGGQGPSKKKQNFSVDLYFNNLLKKVRDEHSTLTLKVLKDALLEAMHDHYIFTMSTLTTASDPKSGKAFNEGTTLVTLKEASHDGKIVTKVVEAPAQPPLSDSISVSAPDDEVAPIVIPATDTEDNKGKAATAEEAPSTTEAKATAPKTTIHLSSAKKALPQTSDSSLPFAILAGLGSLSGLAGLLRRKH